MLPLSYVSIIPHCSILIFISLILSEGQTDEAWEPSNTGAPIFLTCAFSQTQSYQWKYQNQHTFPHYNKHELSTFQHPVLPLSPLMPEGRAGTTWEPTEQESFLRPLWNVVFLSALQLSSLLLYRLEVSVGYGRTPLDRRFASDKNNLYLK